MKFLSHYGTIKTEHCYVQESRQLSIPTLGVE